MSHQTPSAPTAAFVPSPRPASPAMAPPMSLAGRMAPPLRLPAEHFAAALAFWVLGGLGLIWIGPDLARGAFTQPRVAAVTHLFTLGWVTTSIKGALYQFLPVALQTPIRSPLVAEIGLALYLPGLTLFLSGLLLGRPSLMVAGAALFGTALLLFVGNLAATLQKAPDHNLTWWALAGSSTALLTTVVLGVSLAGNLRWGYLGIDRFLAVGVHIHVAVFGWVLLTIVGVAHRLMPMFLLSHGASERPGRIAAGLLAAGVGLLIVVHHALNPVLIWLIAALLAGGVAALVTQAALYFRHRKRPKLDPGLRLAGAALLVLVAAMAIAPFFITGGLEAPRIATAYGAALVGAVSLFVAGHYYKILPFLIWFHRFGPLVGRQEVPRVVDLYASKPATAAAVLLVGGIAGIIAGALSGSPLVAQVAGVLFACGAVIVALQMISIFRQKPS